MAAPTPTARQTPTGFKMPDGYSTKMTFASQPSVQLWEETVKPPGFDGGDPIATTTMHNVRYRTMFPKALQTLTPSSMTAMYDPDVISNIQLLINKNDVVTVWFPDGSSLAFWGALTKFEPSEHKEGDPPKATCNVAPTNWDHVNGVEAGPVFTPAAGT